ncbi:MAG: hypothetical protein LBE08_06880 [Bifidobacteriaceae bacterium]|jgi:hypothetical protein|nr:hypothetical protein [Bifidobacteriaceae bacterium]
MGGKKSAMAALVALVMVALGVGAYLLAYAPLIEEKQAADSRAEAVEAENEAARRELKDLAAQQEQLPAKIEALAQAQAQFPTSIELARFTLMLSSLIEQSQATIVRVQLQDPEQMMIAQALPTGPGDYAPPVVAQPPSNFYQYQFTVQVQGTWPQAQDFLELLQREGTRMSLVTEVDARTPDMVPTDTESGVFDFSIKGYTYALVPADQVPTKADTGGDENESG